MIHIWIDSETEYAAFTALFMVDVPRVRQNILQCQYYQLLEHRTFSQIMN